MFRLSSSRVSGLRVLIVEDDLVSTVSLTACVRSEGATVVACVPTIPQALHAVSTHHVDRVVLGTQYASWPQGPLQSHFAQYGAELIYVTGFDDWFDLDDDVVETEAAGHPDLAYG